MLDGPVSHGSRSTVKGGGGGGAVPSEEGLMGSKDSRNEASPLRCLMVSAMVDGAVDDQQAITASGFPAPLGKSVEFIDASKRFCNVPSTTKSIQLIIRILSKKM